MADMQSHLDAPPIATFDDVNVLDKVALVFLSVIMITIGVYPSIIVPLVESGVENILRLLGGA